jgi:hypothetical protein
LAYIHGGLYDIIDRAYLTGTKSSEPLLTKQNGQILGIAKSPQFIYVKRKDPDQMREFLRDRKILGVHIDTMLETFRYFTLTADPASRSVDSAAIESRLIQKIEEQDTKLCLNNKRRNVKGLDSISELEISGFPKFG